MFLLFQVFNNRVTNARNTASLDAPSPIGPGMDMYGRRIDIAFLCRHGKHRSVALVELWSAFFNARRVTNVTHHWAMSQWNPPCRARRCADCTSPEHRQDLVNRMSDLWKWAAARHNTRSDTHVNPHGGSGPSHAAAAAAAAPAAPPQRPQQHPTAPTANAAAPPPQQLQHPVPTDEHGQRTQREHDDDTRQPPTRRVRPPSRDPPPLPPRLQTPSEPSPPPAGDVRLRDPRHPALTSLQYLITPEGIQRREPAETTPAGAPRHPTTEGGGHSRHTRPRSGPLRCPHERRRLRPARRTVPTARRRADASSGEAYLGHAGESSAMLATKPARDRSRPTGPTTRTETTTAVAEDCTRSLVGIFLLAGGHTGSTPAGS